MNDDKPKGIPLHRHPTHSDKFEDRCKRYIAFAKDGEKRTSSEIRDEMGMIKTVKVTSFLRTAKFRFAVDGSRWRVNVATRADSKLVWWLTEKGGK